MKDSEALQWLTAPSRLWSRQEVLNKPSPVPRTQGVYGCFFKQIPGEITTTNCVVHNELTLLYLGICPGRAKGNKPLSKRTMFDRVCGDHMKGNAEGSTLRLSLGALLANTTGFPLRCILSKSSSSKPRNKLRKTLTNQGEQALDAWMDRNIFLVWKEMEKPWLLEEELIKELSIPLNLQGNEQHPFHPELSRIRSNAKNQAVAMDPVLDTHPRS